jgi:hypothetical protein
MNDQAFGKFPVPGLLMGAGAILVAFQLSACYLGSNNLAPSADADASTDAGPCSANSTLGQVQALFAMNCAGSTCHSSGPGGNFPPLADTPPESWVNASSHEVPGQPLVVPGNPGKSTIYLKVTGMQSVGALMPLGSRNPNEQIVSVIQNWISAGAPTTGCADDAGASPPVDPNTLDQGALFTCLANSPPSSSPQRLRRIDSPEWTYSLPSPLNGTSQDDAYLNPFTPLATQPYSTYSAGVQVDGPTLDLYFQVLADAPLSWVQGPGGLPLVGISGNPSLDCMWSTITSKMEATPTDTCIDNYVDTLLTQGVLFRTPTAAEHASLRGFLVTALAAENGDVTKRQTTVVLVDQAAWLMPSALFRTEIGAPAVNDSAMRNRLTNDELALAVSSMLSFHRPGAPMIAERGVPDRSFVGPSDPDDLCHPWLYQIRQAADNGTLQDPQVIKSLIAAYGGGVDPGGAPVKCGSGSTDTTVRRRDQSVEYAALQLGARGEYWLAPRIADFFRQWLAYGTANDIFKDQAGGTSRFLATADMRDPTSNGFAGLQTVLGYQTESSLVQQLDDTIARTVVDAATNHQDVFKALMTTRLWHLPSDQGATNGVACKTDADCVGQGYYIQCTLAGLCGDSTGTRVYNHEGVPATDSGRWVTMPATERSGVLTHPAWLTAAGQDNFQDDPNLIHRGKWVREKLFCETVPPLQLVQVLAALGERAPTLSARDRVHAAVDPNATCLGCHRLMNTLGYPFEMYDHAGFLRLFDKYDADAQGNPTAMHPPDATTVTTNLPDPGMNGSFTSALDFVQRISESQYARRCFIRQAFRYFMGRDETMADQCTLTAMEQALGNGSFFDMLASLASSDDVLYRSTGGM